MFVLKSETIVSWPVRIEVPQDGGKFQTHQVTASFEVVPTDEVEEILAGPDGSGAESRELRLLRRALRGWTGIKDEGGNEIVFADEDRDQALRIPFVRRGFAEAYFEMIRGAKRKN